MILLKILDIKDTMSQLLLKESFDSFFIEEVEVVTYAKMTIAGKRNMSWYDSDDVQKESLLRWTEIKKVIFEYIKGKKTPSYMKISLKADNRMIYELLKDSGCMGKVEEYNPELYIQIRYENDNLDIVTGISYEQFVMDKTIEHAWDEAIQKWLKMLKVSYVVC